MWRLGACSTPPIDLCLLLCKMGGDGSQSSLKSFLAILLSGGLSQQAMTVSAMPVPAPQGYQVAWVALNAAGLPGVLQILARCDIMVLQEVVDSSSSAISLLLRELNR